MTEYNLTWQEAKEAMKRGAIVNGEIWCNHRLFNGYLQYSVDNDNSWISNKNEELEMVDYRGQQWRIVELTDCEITELGIIYGECYLNCKAHIWTSTYPINCESKDVPRLKEECINAMRNGCIKMFTKQLKEDMKPKFLDPIPFFPAPKIGISIDLENDLFKHITSQDPNALYKVEGRTLIREQKMQEHKIYSFGEALHGMRNGKFYRPTSCELGAIGLINGNVGAYNIDEKKFDDFDSDSFRKCSSVNFYIFSEFIEVENPEKKEPEFNQLGFIIPIDNMQSIEKPRISIEHNNNSSCLIPFFTLNEWAIQKKWVKSLETFLQLKSHPLAVKPVGLKNQYVINVTGFGKCIRIDQYTNRSGKMSEISAIFNSENDAQQAIQDIGENNLVEMFKVFSGVYE